MTVIEKIYAKVLPGMKDIGIEDTTQHRLMILERLMNGAGIGSSFNTPEYQLALRLEIVRLQLKLHYEK